MMTYRQRIVELCQDQTDLSQEDISCILSKADELMAADTEEPEDIFIDVKSLYSEHAVVVFHKKPSTCASLYERTVVGDKAYLEKEPGVLRTLETGVPTIGLSAISQEGMLVQQTVFPIFRENKVIACLILERQADKMKPLHFSIKKDSYGSYELDDLFYESYAQQFSFLKYMEDGALVFNQNGQVIYANDSARELYRKQLAYMDSIDGMTHDNLVLDHISFQDILISSHQLKEQYSNLVEREYGRYWFSVKQYVIPEMQCLVMICRDITASKRQQQQLVMTEVALREMNHRVKNHLQTVVSLLRLQANQSQSPEVQKNLMDSINRVLSIAMMHERLSIQDTDWVLVAPLIQGVVQNIQNCFASEEMKVIVDSKIDASIELNSDRALALALIINELLQNSYEHAF
ncbi:histidine kinase N-terminal domain-containing protein [Streptococcus rupicaprae]